MKVLLFGEYNRAQWNIRQGLLKLGHEAIVVSSRDGFKKVDVDIELKNPFESYWGKKFRILFIKLFNIDLLGLYTKKQILKLKPKLSNYDVVQFVNEAMFSFERTTQLEIFNMIHSWNKNSFLLSAGLDYTSVKYAYDKRFRYSILTPYFENKGSRKDFSAALSYLSEEHIKLHNDIFDKIKGVISNDLDYHIPLMGYKKYLGMIPHAINTENLIFNEPDISEKIVIFHGINRANYYKKGNDIFKAALGIIQEKYSEKVEIITVENLPYKDYIKAFDGCHVLLDQVYAYDQGYNALEAMAKGKVVFTGAEQEFLEYYGLVEDEVCINALPNAEKIAEKLGWLISNPDEIVKISKQARAFVEREHNYETIVKRYLEIWNA